MIIALHYLAQFAHSEKKRSAAAKAANIKEKPTSINKVQGSRKTKPIAAVAATADA